MSKNGPDCDFTAASHVRVCSCIVISVGRHMTDMGARDVIWHRSMRHGCYLISSAFSCLRGSSIQCIVSMPPKPKSDQRKRKTIDRHSGWVTTCTFSKKGKLLEKNEFYDPEYEHWGMKVFDRNTGMVTWTRFDKDRKLELKEFYDPLYELWPIQVVDKHTGMVTWKRFDYHFNLEVQTFYVPELHNPEAQPRLGWVFCLSSPRRFEQQIRAASFPAMHD